MKIRILWPGRTKNQELRALQDDYLKKIRRLASFELVETREAKGWEERFEEKIKEIEAAGLEKRIGDDYIICLTDEGREMNSKEFARFLEKGRTGTSRSLTFILGGFLGLSQRILERADTHLSLSKMTFSHELCRVMLLEQVYRALTVSGNQSYAK